MGEAQPELSLTIRPMNTGDVDAVLAVEQASFATPWSRDSFVAEAGDNDLACYLVLQAGNEIVGYAGVWVVLDEAHVTNVAIMPAFRGQRLGARLMTALMAAARARGARRMTLEVRPSNEAARRLYGALGFVIRGLRPGYYSDNKEDALIMWRDEL